MARTALLVVLALAAAPAAEAQSPSVPNARPVGAAPSAGKADAGASRAILEEVSGTVHEVDRRNHRLSVDTGSERVTLSLDRNTMVYTPAGLGTVLDVTPGAQIRAGRNAEFLAYWVQVRGPPKDAPPSTPGQGTGPGGGSGPPPGESGGAVPSR